MPVRLHQSNHRNPTMNQDEKLKRLDEITAALGGTVTRQCEIGPSYSAWQCIALPDAPSISLHYYEDRKGDYIHASVNWPRDGKGNVCTGRDVEYNATNPEIRFSAAKAPTKAAGEIARRLLPAAAPLYAKALEACHSRDRFASAVAANYASIAAAAGTVARQAQHNGNWYVPGLPSDITIDFVSDDSVTLRVRMSPSAAADLIRQMGGQQ
jgi:hypothetical protein